MKEKERNLLNGFLRQKDILGSAGADPVYRDYYVDGVGTETMLFQDGEDVSTLYFSREQTTYISISEKLLQDSEDNTTTVREKLNVNNTMFNVLVVANAILKNRSVLADEPILDSDALLLMIYNKEKRINFNLLNGYLDEANDVHNLIMNDMPSPITDKMTEDIRLGSYVSGKYALEPAKSSDFLVVMHLDEMTDGEKPTKSEDELDLSKGLSKPIAKGEPTEKEKEESDEVMAKITSSGEKVDKGDWFSSKNILSRKEIEDAEDYAKKLASKLRGYHGKQKTISPSKKVSTRNFTRKLPNIYIKKRDKAKGKKIKLNILIDASSSMKGVPMNNAMSIAMIFEIIAHKEKTITGNIILSAGEGTKCIPFGIGSKALLARLKAFSGSEGIEYAIQDNMKILQDATYNICISDADITDSPINKKSYESKNVFIDAMYVGRGSKKKGSKKKVKKMEKFFSRGFVSEDLETAIEYISNVVLSK